MAADSIETSSRLTFSLMKGKGLISTNYPFLMQTLNLPLLGIALGTPVPQKQQYREVSGLQQKGRLSLANGNALGRWKTSSGVMLNYSTL